MGNKKESINENIQNIAIKIDNPLSGGQPMTLKKEVKVYISTSLKGTYMCVLYTSYLILYPSVFEYQTKM